MRLMITPLSPLRALALKWQVLSIMFTAMARRVSLATKMQNHSDAAFAQMLEAAIYTALIELSADIAAHSARDEALSKEDRDAMAYLKAAHALLGVMALLIRQLRTDLETAAARFAALAGLPVLVPAEIYFAEIADSVSKAPP